MSVMENAAQLVAVGEAAQEVLGGPVASAEQSLDSVRAALAQVEQGTTSIVGRASEVLGAGHGGVAEINGAAATMAEVVRAAHAAVGQLTEALANVRQAAGTFGGAVKGVGERIQATGA